MLFALPDHDTLYAALTNKDPSYDGQAFVAVSSTGIFCKFTCPARKPLQKNCTFYDTIHACLEAGYRPCKRCDPTGMGLAENAGMKTLYDALASDPHRKWQENDIADLGLDLSTVRRQFKRHFGMTFLELARLTRLRHGFAHLAQGGRVIDAQYLAGFESASAFRDTFVKVTGLTPSQLQQTGLLSIDWIDTPLGPMVAIADKDNLHLLEFIDRKGLAREVEKLYKANKGSLGFGRTPVIDTLEAQLNAFFNGTRATFDIPLVMHGTPFTQSVWRALQNIPAGKTMSYGGLAQAIGQPTASRAVARANGSNQIAIVIPCHRVIGADGTLTGYAGGLWRKQKLIETEALYS